MQTGDADDDATTGRVTDRVTDRSTDRGTDRGTGRITGEARVRIEGGVAHFPGLAREQVVSFDELDAPQRREIASLATAADFFDCTPAPDAARPDARTYSLCLTIDGRSREVRVAEPIRDPALARLVSAVRRLASGAGPA